MRVIPCPSCQEPLPGYAKFCTRCGEVIYSSVSSPLHDRVGASYTDRPTGLKVPHFHLVNEEIDDEETIPFARSRSDELAATRADESPAKGGVGTLLLLGDEDTFEPISNGATWHRVVDPQIAWVPPKLPPRPFAPVKRAKKRRRVQPALFFWLATVAMVVLVLGGLLGVMIAVG